MADFDNLIRKNVDDLGQIVDAFGRRKVAALEVSMAVKMVARLCNLEQPVDGLQSLVSMSILIMDTKGW